MASEEADSSYQPLRWSMKDHESMTGKGMLMAVLSRCSQMFSPIGHKRSGSGQTWEALAVWQGATSPFAAPGAGPEQQHLDLGRLGLWGLPQRSQGFARLCSSCRSLQTCVVAMPFASSSVRSLLVARPGAPSGFLLLVVRPGAPSSFLWLMNL